jgi:hypothetical protein
MKEHPYEKYDRIELIETPTAHANSSSAFHLEYLKHGGLDLVILEVVMLRDDGEDSLDGYAYLVQDSMNGYTSYIWPDDVRLRRQHKKSIINYLIKKL